MEEITIFVFCLSVILILFLGVVLQNGKKTPAARAFSFLLLSIFFSIFVNMLSELVDGKAEWPILVFAINLVSFIGTDFMVLAFTFYLKYLIEGNNAKSKHDLLGVWITVFFSIAINLILGLAGKLYSIEEGFYVAGPLEYLPYLISGIMMVELVIVIIKNRKSFTKRQFVVIIIYEVFPFVPIVLELLTNAYYLTAVSTTLAALMIYALIQATAIERGKVREAILKEVSATDLLTNLSNRRAFYDQMASLNPDENIGVFFCDLNKLKYTNDHFGHSAGDALIQQFASLLEEAVGHENAFRISGDEFVALIPDISLDDFEVKTDAFRFIIKQNDQIAALGASFGAGNCVEHLVAEAEDAMYVDKEKNHLGRKRE